MNCALGGICSLQRVFHRAHAGHRVNGGANSAEALGKQPCFARVASQQNVLDAAPHGAAGPGLRDTAAFHLHVNPKVTFNPRNWVYVDPLSP